MRNRISPDEPFRLPPLPPVEFEMTGEVTLRLLPILLKARTELGELKGYASALPNPMLLLSPAIVRESVASSQIENINTTVEEVLQRQLFPESEQRPADKEVLRYRDAVLWGFEQLNTLPISTRLILGIHHELMPSSEKAFRKTQNKIENTVTREAVYTPPVASEVPALINNWEKFVNETSMHVAEGSGGGLDALVRAAVAHYQFEAIHPFGDGNGRTGRILIVLQLIQDQLLSLPILYISGYINTRRSEYYRLLNAVTRKGEWEAWIVFMINGFYEQALGTKKLLFGIKQLYGEVKENLRRDQKRLYNANVIEAIFTYPIISPVRLGKELNVHYTTASKYLSQLEEAGFLKSAFVGKYHLFVNQPLLDILK